MRGRNMEQIYLDHNATTPMDSRVLEAMRPYFNDQFGNAASLHGPGQRARVAVDDSRRLLASLFSCESGELIFTSGGTESDNLSLIGVARAHDFKGHMVVSGIEHTATLETAQMLEEMGVRITRVAAGENGVVDAGAMVGAFEEDTILVSLMLANNETGAVQPVAEVGREARRRGIIVHCDAVQALGKIPFDIAGLNADLVALSAHKIYGPKGIGLLYNRFGTRMAPLITGGTQEYGKRGGTTNVPGIVGFAEAVRLVYKELDGFADRLRAWSARFVEGLLEELDGVAFNGHPTERLPGTVNLAFDGVHSALLVQMLDMSGVCASPGSACQSGAAEPSHVLAAMGLGKERARSSVRFSFGRLNCEEQVEPAVRIVAECVRRYRGTVGAGSANANGTAGRTAHYAG